MHFHFIYLAVQCTCLTLTSAHSSCCMTVFREGEQRGCMVFRHEDCMKNTKTIFLLFHNAPASLLHLYLNAKSQLSEKPLSRTGVQYSLTFWGLLLKLASFVIVIYKLGNYRDFHKFHLFYYHYQHTIHCYSNYITKLVLSQGNH
jgi:hypothetical protein